MKSKRLFLSMLLVLSLLTFPSTTILADPVNSTEDTVESDSLRANFFTCEGWQRKGEIGISWDVDYNRNQNKDIWHLISNIRLNLSKEFAEHTWVNRYNINIGRKSDNTGIVQSPDVVETDFDWRFHNGGNREEYRFINLALKTNSRFENDCFVHLTGGYAWMFDQYLKLMPGFGIIKNINPSNNAQAILSLKADFEREIWGDVYLSSETEFLQLLGDNEDLLGKSDWNLKKTLGGNYNLVFNYRVDYKKSEIISKTWYKGRIYLSRSF